MGTKEYKGGTVRYTQPMYVAMYVDHKSCNKSTSGCIINRLQGDIKQQDLILAFINHEGCHWTLLVCMLLYLNDNAG